MKKHPLIHFFALVLLCAGCKDTTQKTDKTTVPDTIPATIPALPDSTLWGHLGEDTGMSALQFITDQGDTLEVLRTNPYTGEDGQLLGEVRNYTDRFALTLQNGGEALLTAINVSQLAQDWRQPQGSMSIRPDGTVSCQGMPYNGWKLWNGHILLSSEQRQEYGMVTRVDTMDILALDDDSLVIRDHINQTISFGK